MTIENIIAMVAPHYCAVCGRAGDLVCGSCMAELAEARKPVCHLCNMTTDGSLFCASCLGPKPFTNAWSTGKYNDVLKYIVQRYKFDHARSAAKPLASLLHGILPQFPSDTIVTYVPTAPGRIRERGFDHAKLLAGELAGIRGMETRETLLHLGNERQVGATRSKRLEQAKKLFAAKDVRPVPYLLVDDVVTTGATIDAASEILMNSGAKAVYVSVVAH